MHDAGLEHLFHGELTIAFILDSIGGHPPDLAEAPSSDGVLVLKQVLVKR